MRKILLIVLLFLFAVQTSQAQLSLGQGTMAGEITQTSAILQARLTKGDKLIHGDLPGHKGWAQFELSPNPDFQNPFVTGWQEAFAQDDYIIKAQVDLLLSNTKYYYRLVYGPSTQNVKRGPTCTFHTLPKEDIEKPFRFVFASSMNYHKFHRGMEAYQGADKDQGYPALTAITNQNPDFFVGVGDNVYYDYPTDKTAKTPQQMRTKWHQQFAQPRFKTLFQHVPTYWLKDDHDYRYNDADPQSPKTPTHQQGITIFKEQVPITTPRHTNAITYRTHRFGKWVQIWFTENRDYRSANDMPDGSTKTIWGTEQKEWLKRTLLESDATFKLLVSPTPLIGPDAMQRADNHANIKGFRNEGDAFFTWLYRNAFIDQNFYIICGDRQWQYHSVHPTGYEEFACGPIDDSNAHKGIKPGNPRSTDPNRLIYQKHANEDPTGGFLMVHIEPNDTGGASAVFTFYDENGTELYREVKTAQP